MTLNWDSWTRCSRQKGVQRRHDLRALADRVSRLPPDCRPGAVVAALGAAAVASAIPMILELSDPYSGLFRMRDAVFEAITGAVGSR